TPASLSIAGPGDQGHWRARAAEMGVGNSIGFLGLIPNAQVRREMWHHDIVVVPSRHDYPEGLPNTICEALASRSPLIISDHPAFSGRLESRRDCLIYRAARPDALARSIKSLIDDPVLYRTLSENSERAHDSLYVGLEWSLLVDKFLNDPDNLSGWVAAHCLQ
ncbi:glycosyltransferase family 4 protein, partial [Loktanella sp. DJP18]|uniref:glycosyltransferase family 4 protein n=1 Tax=Loktanella sp. DJP18 TaxID=3409788 RepID=UPI003BB75835